MVNTHPHTPVLTSLVCLAAARGKDKRFSGTKRVLDILKLLHPSFGESREEAGRGRERRQGGSKR